MSPASETFGKVAVDNRPPRRRRDPDEDTPVTPAPAPAVAPVEPPVAERPTQPGPNDPLPQPPGPAEPDGPSRAAPGVIAARDDDEGGTLASVITAPGRHQNGSRPPVSDGVAALMNLAAMAERPTDPMADWVGDGTRLPRFIAEAVRLYGRLVGRKTQEVMRDVLLGEAAIPGDVLDAAWMRLYGFPREQYDPAVYR